MKLLVTGCRGQLGLALARVAPGRAHIVVGFDLPELDITQEAAVLSAVKSIHPDAIINCAAFTAVDAAESQEETALAVNGTAVGHLARAADDCGALLLQVSTDYVFDGTAAWPYREDDTVRPASVYGRTKLAGEKAALAAAKGLVVRTAWLFGEGNNFVEAICRQLAAGALSLRVVDDQTGCPTYADDLAEALLGLIERGATGIFHAVNAGSTTWCGFAREILRQLGAAIEVVPITTKDAARPAPRPLRSILDTARLESVLGTPLPPWPDALARYLAATGRIVRGSGGRRGSCY
ncbi:MAG: dTDP-4-dehydrorhamnose reductase [Acidobacteriota bacterium]